MLGADHPQTLETIMALASVRREQGRFDEAESLARDGVARARRALSPPDEVTSLALVTLGGLLNARQRYVEARPLLEEGLVMQKALTPQHWYVAAAQCELGESLRGLRQYDSAKSLLVEGCGGVLASTEPGETRKRRAAEHVASLYDVQGNPAKAAEWRAKLPKPAAPTPVK